ncbi:MAG: ABC transporter [Microcystis aeruginosa BS13-02]|nr:ABC transporter [Microcystis aeruginosa BS13-02]
MISWQKYSKFLYIPALFLGSAGLTVGLISGQWSSLSLGLLIAGAILFLGWLLLLVITSKDFWQKRSTRTGTQTLITTIIVLSVIGLINFLALRYPYRVDLTENQIFSLSPQTERLLTNLSKPVKVWIFSSRGISANEEELLANYQRKNPQFQYEIVNPEKKPNIAQEFKKLADDNLSRVYLQYGDKKQPLKTISEEESLTEAKLSNAIETAKTNRTLTAYFLQGHGENAIKEPQGGLVQAVNSLEAKGYQVEPLNLVERSTIPNNADVIIIASPKRKIFPQEVTALKNYLEQGGKILLMIDPQTETGLEPLLTPWGVKLDNRIIIDASGAGEIIGLGPASPIITNYGNHPITRDFANGISIFPFARPIATVPIEGIEAVSLMITNDKMWAESDLNDQNLQFNPEKDLAGPFDLGVALTGKKGKLIVIGNANFASDGLFEQQLNGDIFLNSVQWLASGETATLSIRAKEPENRRINLNPLQANAIFWIAMVVMPLVGFTLAGLTWWQRR